MTGGGLPRWSPDGTKLAYTGQGYQAYVADSSGANPRRITDIDGMAMYPVWSPDGNRIVFSYLPGQGGGFDEAELYVVGLDGSPPESVTTNDVFDAHAYWW
jgi:Tol biopolymer transport system component